MSHRNTRPLPPLIRDLTSRLLLTLYLLAALALYAIASLDASVGDPSLPPDPAGRLHCGAESNDLPLITRALSHGTPVDSRDPAGNTPLLNAARRGSLDAVRLLLSRGADPNAQGGPAAGTPLIAAARYGRRAAVRELLAHGARPDLPSATTGETPLHAALTSGDPDPAIVRLLRHAIANRPKTSCFFTPF